MGIQINGQTDTVTATDGSINVGGDVTIPGVLTYDDVTNIDSIGIITARSDVSIADKIIHTGDTNTAFRFPAADTVTIETGGTEALRIGSDQKVYFGDFASAGSKAYIEKEVSGDYKLNIHASSSTTQNRIITFNSREDVEAMRLDASGNLGINTTGPNAKLTVGPVDTPTFNRGAVAIKAVTDDNSLPTNIYLEEESGAEGYQLSVDSNGDLNFHNSGAAVPTVTFSDDNRVGIGTDIPGYRLEVQSPGNGQYYISGKSSLGVNIFQVYESSNGDGNHGMLYLNDGSGTTDVKLSTNGDSWFNGGRLLIGHTASHAIDSGHDLGLQVSGTDFATSGITGQRFSDGVSGASLALSHSRNATQGSHTILQVGDEYGKIRFYGSDGTDFDGYGAAIIAKVETGIADGSTPGRLEFHTTASGANNGTERLRIHANGAITKPSLPILMTNIGNQYGGVGSLTTTVANCGIHQESAYIDRGATGWTTSGSNAYTFVCPVDGIYAINAHVSYGGGVSGRQIWVMAYTMGGGNLPLATYTEVMDHTAVAYANISYYNLWSFTAGTRVGFGKNNGSGLIADQSAQWGIHLVA